VTVYYNFIRSVGAAMIEISPFLSKEHKDSLYVQLYQYIRKEIETGRIMQDTRLPSIRRLSQHLNVSKITVETAYQQLVAEGYACASFRGYE
jgi:GntR family transcriptional regulator/MocR family aminotransferase